MDWQAACCGSADALTDSITAGPTGLPGLGSCLMVRNVPAGQCSYACVYCCRGGTSRLRLRRRPFHPIAKLESDIRARLTQCAVIAHPPRFLAVLPGGEPTLDAHLGAEVRRFAGTGHRVVVWTNASLLWRPEVRDALLPAARVMVKLDTIDVATWRLVNRPARQLRLARVLEGLEAFRDAYDGPLDTETTLVPGLNDSDAHVRDVAAFLRRLRPACSYVVVRGRNRTSRDRMIANVPPSRIPARVR